MKTYQIIVAAAIALFPHTGNIKAQNTVNIGKSNIILNSRMMTPEAMWAMGRIASAEASADGKKIVYQVGYYSVKENKNRQVICTTDADGKNNRQLTTGTQSETDPTWTNGRIAYLSAGEIWTMEHDGTDRRRISDTKGTVEAFKFSPDGKKVIIVKSLPFNDIIKKNPDDLPLATGRRITDLMYRHWDHYVESIQHPFIADVNTDGTISSVMTDILDGEPYECPMEPFGGIEQLAWSPSSKTIAYTCRKKTGRDYAISTDSDIYLYNVDTKETQNLCKEKGYTPIPVSPTHTMKDQKVNSDENLKNNPGYDTNPQFSPDGKHVAWLSMARDGYEADRNRLCIYTFESGAKDYVTESFDSNVDAFCWSADSKTLSFVGVWHGCINVYQTNMKGEVKQLTNDWADYISIAPANDGNKLLAMRQSLSAPTDIYIITPGKEVKKTKIEQVTKENKHILDQLTFGKVQQRWVKTTDGKDMLCWIILPADFNPDKKYPTLLFCEGGPQSPVSQFWSYRWNFQLMAAQGYIVVAPNRRGLPSFGQEWLDQISGDYSGQNIRDYLAAIDDVAREPWADRTRMGCVGASYGGYSVYFLAGCHEKRFKAFVSHCGIFDFDSMYGQTEELWFVNNDYGGPYWDAHNAVAQRSYANSPHKFAAKWDTPMLIITGEKDFRIPYTQSLEAFTAARVRGIPARLVEFEDEAHQVFKPQNSLVWNREFFGWLDRYVKQ